MHLKDSEDSTPELESVANNHARADTINGIPMHYSFFQKRVHIANSNNRPAHRPLDTINSHGSHGLSNVDVGCLPGESVEDRPECLVFEYCNSPNIPTQGSEGRFALLFVFC